MYSYVSYKLTVEHNDVNTNNPNSYESVMKELEEVNDLLESNVDMIADAEYDDVQPTFRFEYAHESITERHSAYKRRISHA